MFAVLGDSTFNWGLSLILFIMTIKLIVGLGNPGTEYAQTRHNAGFWFLDNLAQARGAHFNLEKGFKGHVAKLPGVWLLKPTTFMNRSGQAVAPLANFYKITPDEVLVVHDELDLAPGAIKLKKGGGSGGHNGLKDIEAQLGTRDTWRLRIGIGHPRELGMQNEVIDFVLHPPSNDHLNAIEEAMKRGLDSLDLMMTSSMEAAMLKLHTTSAPKPNGHKDGVAQTEVQKALKPLKANTGAGLEPVGLAALKSLIKPNA